MKMFTSVLRQILFETCGVNKRASSYRYTYTIGVVCVRVRARACVCVCVFQENA